ncbi:MAG: GNAT family N-acetyltransferase [Aridibacter famidurans]|nr:GNAT family N-acetyltransferase [Aridibacter famidurans]
MEMVILEAGEGIEMRPVAEDNIDELCKLVIANFDHLHEWMPWAVEGYSAAHARSFILKSARDFAAQESMNFHIFESGDLAGGAGLNFIDKANRGTEIGYWLGREFTGRGIVTKCAKRLTDFAFDDLGMHRMNIRCASGNVKSRAIPERLGFTEEGTIRDAEWLHDRFVDLVVYGMLRPEWRSMSGER